MNTCKALSIHWIKELCNPSFKSEVKHEFKAYWYNIHFSQLFSQLPHFLPHCLTSFWCAHRNAHHHLSCCCIGNLFGFVHLSKRFVIYECIIICNNLYEQLYENHRLQKHKTFDKKKTLLFSQVPKCSVQDASSRLEETPIVVFREAEKMSQRR